MKCKGCGCRLVGVWFRDEPKGTVRNFCGELCRDLHDEPDDEKRRAIVEAWRVRNRVREVNG